MQQTRSALATMARPSLLISVFARRWSIRRETARHLACVVLIGFILASAAPSHSSPEAVHPLHPWASAHVLVFGPGGWSVSVRKGGYFSGYGTGSGHEFTGQLTPAQISAMQAVLRALPKQKARYRFGVEQMEGPSLAVEVHEEGTVTTYWVGLVNESAKNDSAFRAVADVADYLCGLLPQQQTKPAMPWKESSASPPPLKRGRTTR